jgi:uncharacterized iron-regulated membrane protein
MDIFFILLIGVLFTLMAGLLIFYFQTQQNFKEIAQKLAAIDEPKPVVHSTEAVKLELAKHRDILFVLEAELSKTKREALTEEELKAFDLARRQIKLSISRLKTNGAWIGLPFEYEWVEMLDRLPNVWSLCQKAELERQAEAQAQAQAQAQALE